MRINTVNNNINCKGYSAYIANTIKSPELTMHILSLKLDDIGHNDLSKWQKIQDKLWHTNTPSDTISLNVHNFMGHDQIAVNNRFFKTLKQNTTFAKSEEQPALELYTWICGLTKRITSGEPTSNPYSNKVTSDFALNTYNNYKSQGFDEKLLSLIFYIPQQNQSSIKYVSATINRSIHNSMKEYFA